MIMRDERCAETIHRLLDDLHGLLLSRKAGDSDDFGAGSVEAKVWFEGVGVASEGKRTGHNQSMSGGRCGRGKYPGH